MRDIGVIYQCFMCDSLMIIGIDQVDLRVYRGKQGKAALNHLYWNLQKKVMYVNKPLGNKVSDFFLPTNSHLLLNSIAYEHCPTCTEFCVNCRYKEFVPLTEHYPSSSLTISRPVVFQSFDDSIIEDENEKLVELEKAELETASLKNDDDDNNNDELESILPKIWHTSKDTTNEHAQQFFKSIYAQKAELTLQKFLYEYGCPLYINMAPPSKKPKWEICYGVGPPSLVLDASRSGRLHKKSLHSCGLSPSPPIERDESLDYEKLIQKIRSHLQSLPKQVMEDTLIHFSESIPIYAHRDSFEKEIGLNF
mmetsp:Transcript_10373/g.15172  ORF Transcript_10373/g.15172 Transcript_10373/m.15172 type:complete len:308 (+) Transcript_10373:70-993(+)